MRIGIITQSLLSNYGGILQNYALQQVLIRMGHTPITIDLLLPRHSKDKIKHIVRAFLRLRWPDKWGGPNRRRGEIKKFTNKHIKKTFPVRKQSAFLVNLYKLDALIAGSDQIWRPEYNRHYSGHLYDMYFRFAESLSVGKIVYAASFGTDEWEYNPEQTEYCHSLVHKIYAVSVREKSGVALCRQYFGIEAQWVLDPTLLLDAEDYEKLCAHIPRPEHPFIAVYLLDIDAKFAGKVEKIGKQLELPLRFFSEGEPMALSIEEWLAMFRDAKYVITDSFHGTIFSIIFNKSFISIGNDTRGMSRFLSLLEQFGLEERLSPEFSADTFLRPILWDEVNNRKRILQKRSIAFLEKNLNVH